MIIIGRPINGISLNGLEYLLNEDQTEMEFKDKETAKQFLREHGHDDWTDEELEDSYMFVEK
jgi:hypothetical protein